VTVLFSQQAGGPDGGGTIFAGEYVVVDSAANAVIVYKSKNLPPTQDPVRGDNIDVSAGVRLFPTDAGAAATVELAGSQVNISITSSSNLMPTPKTPTFADLDHANPNPAMIGSYVQVPAGTENFAEPAMQFTADGGHVYQDGFSLSDGQGHTIWVDTNTMRPKPSSIGDFTSCFPGDGGAPDFSAGGFRGFFDYGDASNRAAGRGAIVYFGHCDDAP
jgi:hypothetical protein